MLHWLIDHVAVIYVLLGLAAVGFGLVFWQTRRGRELR